MKKTYTKKQITEAIAYWTKQINESEDMTKQQLKDEIRNILYSDMTASQMIAAIEDIIDNDDE